MIIKDLIVKPELDGVRISFLTQDLVAVNNLIDMVDKKPLEAKIKPYRAKRSVEANAYMWILCDKIAEKLHSTKEEVYRSAVREVGVFQDVAVQEKALSSLIDNWTSNGIGWITDIFDSKINGCKRVRLYTGSHRYDTKQMSRLIDYIVEEAKELDIETMTPDELRQMIGENNGASL